MKALNTQLMIVDTPLSSLDRQAESMVLTLEQVITNLGKPGIDKAITQLFSSKDTQIFFTQYYDHPQQEDIDKLLEKLSTQQISEDPVLNEQIHDQITLITDAAVERSFAIHMGKDVTKTLSISLPTAYAQRTERLIAEAKDFIAANQEAETIEDTNFDLDLVPETVANNNEPKHGSIFCTKKDAIKLCACIGVILAVAGAMETRNVQKHDTGFDDDVMLVRGE